MKDFRSKVTREEFDNLGATKGLRLICENLIEKGVPKREIVDSCESAGYMGLPGSLGHRYSQTVTGAIVLGFGIFWAYLGHKFDNPSYIPEAFGSALGLLVGLNGLVFELKENTPLIETLVEKHPKELREVYLEKGYSKKEIDGIFSRNSYDDRMTIFYGSEDC